MVMKKLVLWYRGGNGGEVDQTVNLLQQFLEQDEAPKAVLDKFFNQQNQTLIGLWQCCSVSDENISYNYTCLLVYAQKLVGHAAIGVYYRTVFLKYGMTLD